MIKKNKIRFILAVERRREEGGGRREEGGGRREEGAGRRGAGSRERGER